MVLENCFVAVMELIFKFVLAARYVLFVCECTLLVDDGGCFVWLRNSLLVGGYCVLEICLMLADAWYIKLNSISVIVFINKVFQLVFCNFSILLQ